MTASLPLDSLVPDHIKQYQAYIPSRPDDVLKALYGCERLFRLNNNENPLGPSPRARGVLEAFPAVQTHQYPSGDAFHLRQGLAERFAMDPEQFVVGNGANEVIGFVLKAFCQEGDNIVTADRTFSVYEWMATFSGVEARLAPLLDFGFDPEALLERVDRRTKLVFLCNPNNPTGSLWDEATFEAFMARIAGRCIVVLDEAYVEFVEPGRAPDGMKLLAQHPNLVVFRTFSKMFALAGLRIGYLAASRELVDIIRRPCIVYSVNALAQVAALASLEAADEWCEYTRNHVRTARDRFKQGLDQLGLPYLAGEGNFVMVRPPMNDALAYRRLMAQGVMVRTMSSFRFPGWLRITLGLPDALEACLEGLGRLTQGPQ